MTEPNLADPAYAGGADTSAEPAPSPTVRILALANQKGGVGKTTTAINLATALAAVGKRVLLLDLDPQGNASTGIGLDPSQRGRGSYAVLFEGASIADVVRESGIPNLSIVPASVHLAGAEIELVNADDRETRLQRALHNIGSTYDYVLIDCPPSLNLLTLNALVAANGVLVPLQCEFYALEGLSYLVQTVERVQRAYNDKLQVEGVLLTMFDKRNSLSEMVAADVRAHFGDRVFRTVIPRNVRVSEAPSHGVPVLLYDHRSAGAQAYIQLAGELLKREGAKLG
ncbi:ParA family protein [Roseiterribacter gracilis]|uniref:Chromosome partitioning protein ParA n=1 Tax=Roseiterribacter gracilis TaxID=2812848 RepID=A0A8S8XDH8_9PROT|nr:chromosome partitioning protein ParA [Rhodospirillales bacterium TMPK1]